MFKTAIQLITFFSLIILTSSCNFKSNDNFIRDAGYDSQLHILGVNYPQEIDTSLLQVIHLSGIRDSGYGLLLNIDSSYSQKEIETLKLKLQKLDINAIHSFDIVLQDSLKKSIRIAMEGAKFIWLIKKDDLALNNTYAGHLLQYQKRDSVLRNLIIIHNQQFFQLKDFLSGH